MRLGFVNNMPDPAFAETETQFLRLLRPEGRCDVEYYHLSGIERSAERRDDIERRYRPLEQLLLRPPDALVVTGTEPKFRDLREESYFDELASLLRWAEERVPVVLLSCLASHAALLAVDAIERLPLPRKMSGVFPQLPDASHSLASGLGDFVLPHSRLNDVPTEDLLRSGYSVAVETPGQGWTVATRERDGRLLVLLQGHPEYSPTALLREYRRDVRRYVEGVSTDYPRIPDGYLDAEGVGLLEAFRLEALRSGAAAMPSFPFTSAADHIGADWQRDSEQLVGNWLVEAQRRWRARSETHRPDGEPSRA